jgi:isopenicillin-N epimerase
LAGSKPLAPLTAEFYGQLFSIPIHTEDPIALQQTLFDRFKIEIPVMVQNDKIYLRYSINAFNNENDLDVLKSAMETLINEGIIHRK